MTRHCFWCCCCCCCCWRKDIQSFDNTSAGSSSGPTLLSISFSSEKNSIAKQSSRMKRGQKCLFSFSKEKFGLETKKRSWKKFCVFWWKLKVLKLSIIKGNGRFYQHFKVPYTFAKKIAYNYNLCCRALRSVRIVSS